MGLFDDMDGLFEGEAAPAAADDRGGGRRGVKALKLMTTTKKMRLLSEAALDDALDWHFEQGASYHVISSGDVDSLTFLRHVLKQQRIEYALLSTWCLAMEDAEEMGRWLERGMVGRLDVYVGEIFKNGYRGVLDALCANADRCGGRVARFRNHSKVMAVFGERFDCVIESSANVNTNPRTEQTCITVDGSLAEFYKRYFDGINDFDGRYRDWESWSRER